MPYKNPVKAKEYRKEYYSARAEKKKEQSRLYKAAHKEEYDKYNKAYYAKNQESQKEKAKQLARSIRLEVLAHYGGKCLFCGDKNTNHLSIDHIDNNGAEHRKTFNLEGGKIYRWLRKNNYPSGFQILCHNHNFEKGHYGTMTKAEFENG